MSLWIVNTRKRDVRRIRDSWGDKPGEVLTPGEFIFDARTAADAAMAGLRRMYAEKALNRLEQDERKLFVIVGDLIEPQPADGYTAADLRDKLVRELYLDGWNTWREGTGVLVLGRSS